MKAMQYSVLAGLVLAGLSAALDTGPSRHFNIRQQRSTGTLDMALRLENLETILRQEQRRNRQTENKLQTDMTEMKERLEKIESDVDENSCPCREMISTQSSVSNIQVSNIEEGLRREKARRYTLENGLELLKSGQKDDQVKWNTLDNRIKDVETNVSNILSVCEEKCEVGKIKLVTLDKRIKDVETNVSNILPVCAEKCEVGQIELVTLDKKTDAERIKQRVCPAEFTKVGTGCYYFEKKEMRTYDDARTECQRRESSLLSFETVAERDEIAKYTRESYGSHWFRTSGKRMSGEWKWIGDNNQQSSISTDVLDNWYPGYPTDITGYDCLYPSNNGQWYNNPCTSKLAFICEI